MKIEDKTSTKRTIVISLTVAIALILVIIALVILFTLPNRSNNSDSSSSNMDSTSEDISSSSYDDYIDITLSHLKSYTDDIHKTVLLTNVSVRDIYSFNTYNEDGYTHIVYGYTINEEVDKYMRMDILLDKEIDILGAIDIIYNNELAKEMFDSTYLYIVVEDNLASKDSFKQLYPGTYAKQVCYKDDYDNYHMSGIGYANDGYVSLDYLSYDHDSYVIDESTVHYNGAASSGRYYELLKALL